MCKRNFSQKSKLKDHVESVHEGKRPYECSICGKTFAGGSNFKQHEMTHLTEKTHECSICHTKFAQVRYLRTHEKIHEKWNAQYCKLFLCTMKYQNSCSKL